MEDPLRGVTQPRAVENLWTLKMIAWSVNISKKTTMPIFKVPSNRTLRSACPDRLYTYTQMRGKEYLGVNWEAYAHHHHHHNEDAGAWRTCSVFA